MSPKFSIGEVCLLHTSHTSLNGEVTVLHAEHKENYPVTGREHNYNGYVYQIGVVGPNGHDIWTEICLKKKHLPGDLSFRSLMDTLKSPQKIEWE